MVAIVGTRRPTHRGLTIARCLAGSLVEAGWVIASGLAYGIDAAAHEGALEAGGETVAVLAHGLDRTYPPAHAGLRRRIARQGCVVTEMPLGAPPLPHCFLRRNRLVAGLAHGVLIVEAPHASGARSTACWALDYGREVLILPGPAEQPQYRGSHELIRDGEAQLVGSLADVLSSLPPVATASRPRPPAAAMPLPGSPARWIWDRLDLDGVPLDELEQRWRGAPEVFAEGLIALELAGLTARLPGGMLARRICRL